MLPSSRGRGTGRPALTPSTRIDEDRTLAPNRSELARARLEHFLPGDAAQKRRHGRQITSGGKRQISTDLLALVLTSFFEQGHYTIDILVGREGAVVSGAPRPQRREGVVERRRPFKFREITTKKRVVVALGAVGLVLYDFAAFFMLGVARRDVWGCL